MKKFLTSVVGASLALAITIPAFAMETSTDDAMMKKGPMLISAPVKMDRMAMKKMRMEKREKMKMERMKKKEEMKKNMMEKKGGMMEKKMEKKDAMMEKKMEKKEGIMEKKEAMKSVGMYKDMTANGLPAEVLADGKTKVLYFFAAWCPSCRSGDATLTSWYGAENSMLPVYKLNYDKESALKQKYGVVSQHTFVKVDGQGNVLKVVMGPSDDALKTLLSQ